MTRASLPVVAALAGVAVTATAGAIPPYIRLARCSGIVDRPCARSAHSRTTPRGAGVVVAAVFAAVAFTYCSLTDAPRDAWTIALGSVLVALIGFLEDIRGLGIALRILLVAAIAALLGHSWFSAPGAALVAVLLLVYLVNTANFMDGINGISAAVAVASCLGLFGLALSVHADDVAALAVLFGASFAGFVPFNAPQARVFLGDAGSYALGAFLCFESEQLLTAGVRPASLLLVLVIPLFDVTRTLVARAIRGEDLRRAHSEHIYQQLARSFGKHWPVSGLVLALSLVAATVSVMAQHAQPLPGDAVCLLAGSVLITGYVATLRWSRRSARSPTERGRHV